MILEPLGFQAGERGANVCLVIPNDDGAFDGSENLEGVRGVSPVQTYLDLEFGGLRDDLVVVGGLVPSLLAGPLVVQQS
jgi:hypothetical protein